MKIINVRVVSNVKEKMKKEINICKVHLTAPLIGLFLLFVLLFLPQCITIPAMYETAEPKEEKRGGISAQYGEGSYRGLCESTKYNYKYAGLRVDYGNAKRHKDIIEAGFEIGSSLNGFFETSNSDTNYQQEAIMLQLDGRLTGKIVTPTNPVRLGLKAAPGLLIYGGVSRINGRYYSGGEISGLSYLSFLLGIGNPEFLTIGFSYYPLFYTTLEPYYVVVTATYHHKKYSLTAGGLLPRSYDDEIPEYHFVLGLGMHY